MKRFLRCSKYLYWDKIFIVETKKKEKKRRTPLHVQNSILKQIYLHLQCKEKTKTKQKISLCFCTKTKKFNFFCFKEKKKVVLS